MALRKRFMWTRIRRDLTPGWRLARLPTNGSAILLTCPPVTKPKGLKDMQNLHGLMWALMFGTHKKTAPQGRYGQD